MANELIQYETDHGKVSLSEAIVKQLLLPSDTKVTAQELGMFLKVCEHQKLNPFLREVYLVKYGEGQPASIVTGKEVFTKRAQKNQDFAGMEAGITIRRQDATIERRDGSLLLSGEQLVGGWCKVYIKGYNVPMFDEVAFHEYVGKKSDGTPTKMWLTKPATMIRKVAIVHALREAFPDMYEGLYSQEEINTIDSSQLPQNIVDVTEIPKQESVKPKVQALRQATASVVPDPEPPPVMKDVTPISDATFDDNNYADEYDAVVEAPINPAQFVIDFGRKHNGKTLEQIAKTDRGYLEWIVRDGRDGNVKAIVAQFLNQGQQSIDTMAGTRLPEFEDGQPAPWEQGYTEYNAKH